RMSVRRHLSSRFPYTTLFRSAGDAYPGPRVPAQVLLEAPVGGRGRLLDSPGRALELFGLAHGQPPAHDLLEGPDSVGLGLRQDRPGVPGRDHARLAGREGLGLEREQAQGVRHGAAALAYGVRDLLLGKAEVEELLARESLR